MNLLLRPEVRGDEEAIARVTEAAFREASHASHTEQFIVQALRDADQLAVSLVAVENHAIVGHVAVSPVTIDGQRDWYGLGPISVLPSHHRKGVGTRLIECALESLSRLDASGYVVLGDPVFYQRFGFEQYPSLVLPGVPQEYFQALPFSCPVPTAVVVYHHAFEATA